MRTQKLENVRIAGICSCVPAKSVDCHACCMEVYGDAEKASNVVKATGVRSRRVLESGETALDLCIRAARRSVELTGTDAADIGAVICVTFTPERQMPCNACQAQARLGLDKDVIAFDLNLACSGWLYGVYVAGLMAKSIGRKVLLLDGDMQTAHLDPNDAATIPLLSDAGTATVVEPTADDTDDPLVFSFLSDGERGDALQLPFGGTISMDGFSVFKFVTTDVLKLIQAFLSETGRTPASFDAFVPHQANMFMIGQIARKLGFLDRLKKCGDVLGNSSSASIPTAIAYTGARGRLLTAGFGGGLSAAVAEISIAEDCKLELIDLGGLNP